MDFNELILKLKNILCTLGIRYNVNVYECITYHQFYIFDKLNINIEYLDEIDIISVSNYYTKEEIELHVSEAEKVIDFIKNMKDIKLLIRENKINTIKKLI